MSGLVLLIAGGATLIFGGGQGRIRLITGISDSRLTPFGNDAGDSLYLGFSLRLDSIRAEATTPDYMLLVWAVDTASRSHTGKSTPFTGLVDAFPLDTMKIRPIGDSDHRFRLREFYPDFTFRYEYPDDKLTAPARAPGITLDLGGGDGEAVVTLRTDQRGKHQFDDPDGLGYRFEYYWRLDADSLARDVATNDQPANKVLFDGEDEVVYVLFSGQLTSDTLAGGKRYALPGMAAESGFTVLYHFPDISFLRAVPATASEQPNRPVARVEVWERGGPATEYFLYPNTKGRIGGDHRIPGTNALLVLGESPKALLRRSDIYLKAGQPEAETDPILIRRGKAVVYKGKYISPLSCHAEYPGSVVLSVRSLTGFWIACAGILSAALALIVGLSAHSRNEKDQRPA